MMNDKKNNTHNEKSNMEFTRKVRRSIDRINQVVGVIGVILFGFLITDYLVLHYVNNVFPVLYMWYGLGFVFLVWFATRKGGCGSCNQGSCSRSQTCFYETSNLPHFEHFARNISRYTSPLTSVSMHSLPSLQKWQIDFVVIHDYLFLFI